MTSTVYFYGGIFSNFYAAKFVDEAGVEYCCTEQYFMAQKALTFSDEATYHKIMMATNPGRIKALGREVRNYNEKVWNSKRVSIMHTANYLKFSQNSGLKAKLLATGDRQLAEASPSDTIWGIGLNEDVAKSGAKWRGSNLLGTVLMRVRQELSEAH